jgi:hypothetical protein
MEWGDNKTARIDHLFKHLLAGKQTIFRVGGQVTRVFAGIRQGLWVNRDT